MTGKNLLEYMKHNFDDTFVFKLTPDYLKNCELAIIEFKNNHSLFILLREVNTDADEYTAYDALNGNFNEDLLIDERFFEVDVLGTMQDIELPSTAKSKWYGSVTPKTFVPLGNDFIANIDSDYEGNLNKEIYGCPYLILNDDIKSIRLVAMD